MSTPASNCPLELEYMTIGDVCDYLEEKGFPDHLLKIFKGIFMKDILVFLMFFQIKSWMDELSSMAWVHLQDQSGLKM